jgi:pimeloyl-ACP methyl ester carboxylesterase
MTLVLLPGLNGTGELFASFIAALGTQFKFLIVEYPSDKLASYQELEANVYALLPVDEQFVILGESFSGPVAIAIAARRPTGLVGLILCCTFAANPRPRLGSLYWLPALLPSKVVPHLLTARALLGKNYDKATGDSVVSAVRKVPPTIVKARLREISVVNVSKQLASITIPILSLFATDDWLVPRRATEQMTQGNINIESVQVKGTHFLLQTNALAAADVVRKFVQQLHD